MDMEYTNQEPPCLLAIIKGIKQNSEKRKAQFVLAYLFFLEQSGENDYDAIRDRINRLSDIRQKQGDYSKKNDFLYFRKKSHYFSDRVSFLRFRNLLLEVAGEQLSFRELMMYHDKKLSICHTCPYVSEYKNTDQEQLQLLGILSMNSPETKAAIWDAENSALKDHVDLNEIFSHYVSLSDIFPNAKPSFYPLYACYAEAVLLSDTYVMSGFFYDLYAFCEKAFLKELKDYGITQKLCGDDPAYARLIFDHLYRQSTEAFHKNNPSVSVNAADILPLWKDAVQSILTAKPYEPSFDIDEKPCYEISKELDIPIAKTQETQQMDIFQGIIDTPEKETEGVIEQLNEDETGPQKTDFISEEEGFFFPFLASNEDVSEYKKLDQEPSFVDKICSISENAGYLYVDCGIQNEHEPVLFLQVKNHSFMVSCYEKEVVKRLLQNKKIMVFSRSPYAVYTTLLWSGMALRECIFPIMEMLDDTFPYEKLEHKLSDSSYYISFLEKNILTFSAKKENYFSLCKLHYFYSFSYFRERFFSCDRPVCSPFLVWYDTENHHSYLQKFDLSGTSSKCSGKILCCEIDSKKRTEKANEISNILDALLILLVNRGDVRSRYISLVERGDNYLKLFSPSCVCEYFSTHLITDLLRLGRQFQVADLQVHFSSEEVIKSVESGS